MSELPANVLRTTLQPWLDLGFPGRFGPQEKILGRHFGLEQLGATLGELAPGHQAYPLHWHRFGEEHLLVLEGELTIQERTPDGRRRSFLLRAGELIAWPANTGIAHACHNASDAPVRFLAVSDRPKGEICHYPDSGKTMIRALRGVGIWDGHDPGAPVLPASVTHQVFAEARAARDGAGVTPLALGDRPRHVAGWRVDERPLGEPPRQFFGRSLSRAAGGRRVFLNLDRLPAGCHPSPLHRHHSNEELLVLLEGRLTLRQVDDDGHETDCELVPGDAVHWAPGGTAHQVLNPGPDDALYAVVGTDNADEVTSFPDRGDHYVAALGQVGSLQATGYFDGELDDPL